MKVLLTLLLFSLTLSLEAATAKFPAISLGSTTNIITDSGTALTRNGTPVGGQTSGTNVLFGNGSGGFATTGLSAQVANAVTDETGSGALAFAASPTFTTSLTLTNGSTGSDLILQGNSANTWLLNTLIAGVSFGGVTNTGQWLFPDGTAQRPSVAWASDADGTGTGIYRPSASAVGVAINGTQQIEFNGADFYITGTSGRLIVGTGSATTGATLERDGAAGTWQIQSDNATPTAAVMKGADGSGTDKNGANFTLEGGQSTGTGRGGALIARTAVTHVTSSSTSNIYEERAHYVPKFVTLTDNTIATVFSVTLPATNSIGMTFTCTVECSDGTDFQSLTTPVTIDAVAKSTTITAVVSPSAAQTSVAASSGTLSVTYAVADGGSNVLNVRVTADTSLTSLLYLRARIVMTAINSIGAGVVITEI